jgi:hypothetical protein
MLALQEYTCVHDNVYSILITSNAVNYIEPNTILQPLTTMAESLGIYIIL